VTPVELRGYLWLQKTRLPGLSCGVVCVILRLAVLVELRLATDRQTDGQTDTGPWLVPRMHSIARQKANTELSSHYDLEGDDAGAPVHVERSELVVVVAVRHDVVRRLYDVVRQS